ncbi:hypothetical protein OHS70_35500 [Streptomyces sp. NBC_00390]|uniref:hypothetical protein n=1 Tax=Streptomyces sp. NBC_00390 TaxID=2975736 RepID=UPI002E204A6B
MPTLEAVTACSRITLFPLGGLMVGYTTQSSDARGLGDIAIVGVVEPDTATGEHLWRMAATMFTNPPSTQAAARWILTQCTRARICHAPSYRDLPGAKWVGEFERTVRLDSLFANHDSVRTGRITLG